MSPQEHEKCLLSISFALFVANNAKKIISSRKNCVLFGYVFKKIIPNDTSPTFLEVGGVT